MWFSVIVVERVGPTWQEPEAQHEAVPGSHSSVGNKRWLRVVIHGLAPDTTPILGQDLAFHGRWRPAEEKQDSLPDGGDRNSAGPCGVVLCWTLEDVQTHYAHRSEEH